jgi:hypothetical protein
VEVILTEAKAKRAELYGAVKEGNLESVARIARRYNAERTVETARWQSAALETCEYTVEPYSVVYLRAFPSITFPADWFHS